MSGKLSSNNSLKLNSGDTAAQLQQQIQTGTQWSSVKSASIDTNVKLAGEEAKDRLYEPKHKKKLVRVLTVVAYVFFVSLAAIMLSLYYIFLWKPESSKEKSSMMYAPRGCDIILMNIAEPTAIPVVEKGLEQNGSTPASAEEIFNSRESTWPETSQVNASTNPIQQHSRTEDSPFIRKLLYRSVI